MATDIFDALPIEKVDGDVVDGPLAALDGGAMQRVTDGQYGSAIQIQRYRDKSLVEVEACRECEKLGESAFYGWGAGKDRIEGPSIKCANVLARIWGNNTVRMEPVQDLGDSWVFTAAFIDLETGATMTRQFRQSKKSKVYGKHDEERKADIRFQIGQSKASRNVIVNALPEWLIKQAMDKAKLGVRKRIEACIASHSIEHARDLVVKSLAKVGVKEAQIADKMGRSGASALTIEDLVTLTGDYRAINEGSESPDVLFPDGAPKTNTDLRNEMSTKPDAKPAAAEPKPPDDGKASENEIQCSELKAEWAELARGFETKRAVAILKDHGIKGILSLKECTDPEKLAAAVEALRGIVLPIPATT